MMEDLEVAFFAECQGLLLLILVGCNFGSPGPFGAHTIFVMNVLGWMFFTAFTRSVTAGKCCQPRCCASAV
jgi:hypothetical protein